MHGFLLFAHASEIREKREKTFDRIRCFFPFPGIGQINNINTQFSTQDLLGIRGFRRCLILVFRDKNFQAIKIVLVKSSVWFLLGANDNHFKGN